MSALMVAEIGINHNGDINIAKQLIDIAHFSKCNYVKFQKRDILQVYSKEELDKPRESPWGTTTREQKEGLELSCDDFNEIDRYCKGKIGWFASPWDVNSLDFLGMHPGCAFIKLPSPLITNERLLASCHNYDKQVILSTGMSNMEEIDRAIEALGRKKIYAILACTSTYPTKNEEINLNFIKTLKRIYPWAKIGFSNHSPGIIFMPVAVALGAEMIEFHITLNRSMYGSDQPSSFEPEGVMKLRKYIDGVEQAMGDGVKQVYASEIPIKEKLRR